MKIINKKISTYLLGAALISSGITGCNKKLELTPTSIISPETVFATTSNAMAAVDGIHKLLYSQWYGNQANGGQSGNMIWMEVLGEDLVMTAAGNGWFNSEYKWQSHVSASANIVRDNYGMYYAVIGNANLIIANIDNAVGTDEERNFIKGQAYAYRAWAYYQMVQLYGKRYEKGGNNSGLGISLIVEPSEIAVPRSTVEETYTQINQDIDEAIRLLSSSTERPHKSHLNINVAKGIKARVALTQQNYELADQLAKEARTGFSLMDKVQYAAGFSNIENPEWIWGIQHRADQTTYFYGFFAYLGNFSSTNTRGNPKAINSLLYSHLSETDIRATLWDPTGKDPDFKIASGGARYPYMTQKFVLADASNSAGDLGFMRVAEMYLIEAESKARLGQDLQAREILNELITTRDSEYETNLRGESLIDEILIQRRLELWGEGFRFYDLKRLNLPLSRLGANHNTTLALVMEVPAGDSRWQFLIPQGEIDRTLGVVVQNPLN
ncbi:MAG: RagB/SusD family nutrient uptake outer membrane protein [Sphingobacterium sp.]|uniref:RagB/SusD family nutrient uptake outer membrane protein n=1 Tax=Sphingobacterium sp. JB170 TaxID=1434842 RepID=UPI00097F1F39|nr:RagB/SusD family nutrient uptake outer membrane protein [Sphingobacterium sp. JB170]SJN50113.1 putative outer membrane protein, probably involved in nutrient binding [Sphingobacterium sp. JB170]